jgi:hypothetical protein
MSIRALALTSLGLSLLAPAVVGADAVANEPEQAVRCAEKLLARGGGS